MLARTADFTDVDEHDEPIADWFNSHVTAEQLPSLHRILPTLIDIDCRPGIGHEIEIFLGGVQTAIRRPGAGQGA